MEELHEKAERKVEYVELIYDLIFVYLVSRNVALLEISESGFIRPVDFFTYLASSLAVLHIWYQSSLYINHFGNGSLREHLMLFINMFLLYHMAGGIRSDWGSVYYRYNGAWGLILLNMAINFLLTARCCSTDDIPRMYCRRQALMLIAEAAIVLISIPIYLTTGFALAPWALVFILAAFILMRNSEIRMETDFPHLAERVMLYIVFTFGEMILAITGYFDGGFSLIAFYYSVMAFAIIVGLFSAYGHYYNHLMNPETKIVSSAYMMLHIVMILALNSITAAMEFLREPHTAALRGTVFLVVSILVFYSCLLGTQRYSSFRVRSKKRFYIVFLLGAAVYFLASVLFCRQPMVGIALTVVYIYFQLYSMHFGAKSAN